MDKTECTRYQLQPQYEETNTRHTLTSLRWYLVFPPWPCIKSLTHPSSKPSLRYNLPNRIISTHERLSTLPHNTQKLTIFFFEHVVACHVSAANIHNMDTPILLKINTMGPNDETIWETASDEEYDCLKNLPAWTPISESEYRQIKLVVGNALQTMAISTIKYDEHGAPKGVKNAALGNLDPHDWSKKDCYVLVLSMPEPHFLVSLTVQHKISLKNGDTK